MDRLKSENALITVNEAGAHHNMTGSPVYWDLESPDGGPSHPASLSPDVATVCLGAVWCSLSQSSSRSGMLVYESPESFMAAGKPGGMRKM